MWGLFESETVTSVSTSVSRVIEDRHLPNSLKTGTIRGIFSGDQMLENILEAMASSIGVKAERMYRYGKNGYIYGAPTSAIRRSADTGVTTQIILQSIEGKGVVIEYAHYAPLNRLHYGWQTLCDTYGYSPTSNELTTLSAVKGRMVYLDNIQVVITTDNHTLLKPYALEQWGNAATTGYTPVRAAQTGSVLRAHTPYLVDPLATADYLKVTYVWRAADGTLQTESINIPMLVLPETEHVQVKYSYWTVVPGPDVYGFLPSGDWGVLEKPTYKTSKYFTYQVGIGTWPELDYLFSTDYDELGSFFPFSYVRFNKTPTSSNKTSAEYKSTNKLLKYLGLNYSTVRDAINTNPQIADVESAFMMMAVPADTVIPIEQRYLFDFFKGLYLKTGVSYFAGSAQGTAVSSALAGVGTTGQISLSIRDARFSTSLGMSGIYRKTVVGVIGSVGSYSSGSGQVGHQEAYEEYVVGEVVKSTRTVYTPYNYYRHQITAHLYEEIQVHSLRMTYNVWGGYVTTNNMVPLDHSITAEYYASDRELLYARSLHFIFNARQSQELEWYEQEWFGTVLMIVGFVLTIMSLGSDGGFFASLGTALANGAYYAAALIILEAILVAIVVSYVMKLFVQLLGPQFAMLVAIIAVAYSMYSGFQAGSIKGAPWAQELLQFSSGLMNAVGTHYSEELQGLKTESEELALLSKDKMDELKRVRESMEGSSLLSPFVIFGETPNDYFNRTVHSGNIGILSIEAISNYVDISLMLPTLAQTTDEHLTDAG